MQSDINQSKCPDRLGLPGLQGCPIFSSPCLSSPSCAEREEGVCADLLLALSHALLSCCLMKAKI